MIDLINKLFILLICKGHIKINSHINLVYEIIFILSIKNLFASQVPGNLHWAGVLCRFLLHVLRNDFEMWQAVNTLYLNSIRQKIV